MPAVGAGTAAEIAELLVRTGAVKFSTDPFFRLTSGTESPVYVDNRQLLGHVAERERVVEALIDGAEEELVSVEAVAGTATAGIPWAAWLASRLRKPMLYVRSEPKKHGRGRAVEGTAGEGARVVVVEDLAFSAGSLVAAAARLREEGFEVGEALTIVSYGTPAAERRLRESGLTLRTLTTVDEALRAAVEAGSLDESQGDAVSAWLQQIRQRD